MATTSWGDRRCGGIFLFLLLMLASCGPVTVTPTAAPVLSLMPVPPTAMPSPSPTAPPSATPTAPSTATPKPPATAAPLPAGAYGGLAPTVNPTALPNLLRTALTVREEKGVADHPLRRVTGWKYGFGGWAEWGCTYRWLDEEHLLLPAFAGEETNMGVEPWTLPVVVNLSSGSAWLPQTQRTTWCCDYPRWSDVLHVLITVRQGDVLFLDPEGKVVQRYPGAGGFDISPSGRRLLIGSIWQDLETGRTVDTAVTGRPAWSAAAAVGGGERAGAGVGFGSWAWSSDETRLFGCCFYYLDVNDLEQSGPVDPGYLEPVGRGLPGCGGGVNGFWALGDRFVVLWWDFFTTTDRSMEKRVYSPFVDPIAQTYTDLCALAGVPPGEPCGWAFLGDVAPGSDHIALRYKGTLYVVGPDSVVQYPLPGDPYGTPNWSPDGRFALLGRNVDQAGRGEYRLFSAAEARSAEVAGTPISHPTWSPRGERLAFFQDEQTLGVLDAQTMAVSSTALPWPSTQILWQPQASALVAFSGGASTLTLVDLENWTASAVTLSLPLAQVLWQPQGAGLVVQADDGSLWWLPSLSARRVEPLTPPLPAVRGLQWSPDGRSLAFASGANVYVVFVAE